MVIPQAALPVLVALLETIAALVKANGNVQLVEEALMQAEERIARERARRKFGGQGG